MKDKTKKKCPKTYIGGQAVLEGVMMRGKSGIATAVRDADGVIRLEADRLPPKKSKILRFPVIRGAVSFFSSIVIFFFFLLKANIVPKCLLGIHFCLLLLDLLVVDIVVIAHQLVDGAIGSQLNDTICHRVDELMVV